MKEEKELNRMIKLAEVIIPKIRSSAINMRLYWPESPVVINSLKDTYSTISEILHQDKSLTLGEKDLNLVINNQIIPIAKTKGHIKYLIDSFVGLLKETQIKSIIFRIGLTYDELFEFFKAICRKRWSEEGKGKTLNEIIDMNKIKHIGINEWTYEAVSASDIIVEGGKEYIDKTGTKFDELTQSLEEVTQIFEKTEDIQLREKMKLALAEKIVKLNPSLLLRFFEEKLTGNVEKVKQEIIAGFPPHYLKEIILKMCQIYKEMKESTFIGTEDEYHLLQLRESINKLLSACKDRLIIADICNELLKTGFPELVPSWWERPQITDHTLTVSQARLLCEKDSLELLEPDVEERLPEIFRVLNGLSRNDLIKELIKKLGQNIKADTATVRYKTLLLIRKIIHIINSLNDRNLIDFFYNLIIEALEEETDEKIYRGYSDFIVHYLNSLIKEGQYKNANWILEVFRKHKYQSQTAFYGRTQCANELFHKLSSSDAMTILIEDIRSRIPERQKNALMVIQQMEEASTPALIDAIKQISDFGLRKFIVEIIKRTGKGSLIRLIKSIDIELGSTELIRLLQILDGLGEDELVVEQLKNFIHHPDAKIRIETIRTLGRLNSQKIGDIIMTGINDPDNCVRREAINIIGDIKYAPAVDELVKLIKPQLIFQKENVPDFIQEAACRAIGRIRKNGSYKHLMSVVKNSKLSFKREKSKSVKISAIFALRGFKIQEVKNFLISLKNEKDTHIKSVIDNVLDSFKDENVT